MKKKIEKQVWVSTKFDKGQDMVVSHAKTYYYPTPATLTYEIEVPCVHEPVPRFDGPCTQDWVIVCKHCGKIVITVWSEK